MSSPPNIIGKPTVTATIATMQQQAQQSLQRTVTPGSQVVGFIAVVDDVSSTVADSSPTITVLSSVTYSTNTSITASATYANFTISNSATVTVSSSATLLIYGTLTIGGGCTLTLNNATLGCYGTVSNSGTFNSSNAADVAIFSVAGIPAGTITISGTVTFSDTTTAPPVTTSATITVNSGGLLIFSASYTLSNIPSGTGTLNIVAGLTLTIPYGTWHFNLGGLGTIAASGGHSITLTGSVTWAVATVDSSITTIINGSGSNTLTIATNTVSWSVTTLTISAGSLALTITTVTLNQNTNITFPASTSLSGTGVYSIVSGITATVSGSQTWSIGTLTGFGTISVSSSYTLTVANGSTAITLSVATLSGAGTLTFNGTGAITIPAGVTVFISTVKGTWSAPFTVNGLLYTQGAVAYTWALSKISTTLSTPTSGSINGTGFWAAWPSSSATATGAISFPNGELLAPGGLTSESATSTSGNGYFSFTQALADTTGVYSLGIIDTGNYCQVYVWFYFGLAAYPFPTPYPMGCGAATIRGAGYTNYAYNVAGSAGTISPYGKCYC